MAAVTASAQCRVDSVTIAYRLHGQKRVFDTTFTHRDDGSILLQWSIVRNLRTWHGSYTMSPQAVDKAALLSFLMPEDGSNVALGDNETFAIMPRKAYDDLVKTGRTHWNCTTYEVTSRTDRSIHARDTIEGAKITILDDPDFPLILSMQDNPLEIDWTASPR